MPHLGIPRSYVAVQPCQICAMLSCSRHSVLAMEDVADAVASHHGDAESDGELDPAWTAIEDWFMPSRIGSKD